VLILRDLRVISKQDFLKEILGAPFMTHEEPTEQSYGRQEKTQEWLGRVSGQ